MRNIFTLLIILTLVSFVKASPIGKGLYCNEELFLIFQILKISEVFSLSQMI